MRQRIDPQPALAVRNHLPGLNPQPKGRRIAPFLAPRRHIHPGRFHIPPPNYHLLRKLPRYCHQFPHVLHTMLSIGIHRHHMRASHLPRPQKPGHQRPPLPPIPLMHHQLNPLQPTQNLRRPIRTSIVDDDHWGIRIDHLRLLRVPSSITRSTVPCMIEHRNHRRDFQTNTHLANDALPAIRRAPRTVIVNRNITARRSAGSYNSSPVVYSTATPSLVCSR